MLALILPQFLSVYQWQMSCNNQVQLLECGYGHILGFTENSPKLEAAVTGSWSLGPMVLSLSGEGRTVHNDWPLGHGPVLEVGGRAGEPPCFQEGRPKKDQAWLGILELNSSEGFSFSAFEWEWECINRSGLRGAQRAGNALFPGVSVRVFLEKISTWISRLNKDHPHTSMGGHNPICGGSKWTKRQRKHESAFWTGSSIFSCPWISVLLAFGLRWNLIFAFPHSQAFWLRLELHCWLPQASSLQSTVRGLLHLCHHHVNQSFIMKPCPCMCIFPIGSGFSGEPWLMKVPSHSESLPHTPTCCPRLLIYCLSLQQERRLHCG